MTTDIHPSNQTVAESGLAHTILHLLFKEYPDAFTVQLWDNSVVEIGHGMPAFKLHILNSHLLYDLLVSQDPVRLGEAYFDGEIEIEGDFNAAMGLRYYFEHITIPLKEKVSLLLKILPQHTLASLHTYLASPPVVIEHLNNQASIAFHYDVSNAFYEAWLDPHMVYSCAYFDTPEQALAQAQTDKLHHICRKLRLKPGDTFLDIGCGWGALVCWAAKHYGVQAHGITLSQKQYEYANERILQQGLEAHVSIELRDYRALSTTTKYDKIASIGMFEHVGLKNLP